jgi:hypothetical protein
MNLFGEQRKRLRDALISAFPERSSLEQLLDFELDKKLNTITSDSNLQTVVYQLIQTAESQGWVVKLVSAARQVNPGNSDLKAIAAELLTTATNNDNSTDYGSQLKYPLEYPDGHVPLESPFYVEHDKIESLCYETLLKPGSLIRIKAPKLMGKTSLLTRILAHGSHHNYQAVYLDLGGIDKALLTNLDRFLRWLCDKVSSELDLDNKVNDAWNTQILGSNDNCTAYFQKHILKKINTPLVLGLDEVDRLFAYTEVVEDFFGMLRSMHEKGKISEVWKKLRLVLAHSTEAYIPLDIHQSPFNAGVPVELEEFNQQQVEDLVQKHGLVRENSVIKQLRSMVGGHPYLMRLAMYHIAAGNVLGEDLLKSATTEAGIYANHLRALLEIVQPIPELAQALKKVVHSTVAVELDSIQIYKLHSLGVVHRQSNHVLPRCQLYRDYFRRVL